jgi:hypothetical protein
MELRYETRDGKGNDIVKNGKKSKNYQTEMLNLTVQYVIGILALEYQLRK